MSTGMYSPFKVKVKAKLRVAVGAGSGNVLIYDQAHTLLSTVASPGTYTVTSFIGIKDSPISGNVTAIIDNIIP